MAERNVYNLTLVKFLAALSMQAHFGKNQAVELHVGTKQMHYIQKKNAQVRRKLESGGIYFVLDVKQKRQPVIFSLMCFVYVHNRHFTVSADTFSHLLP